jgi:ATP-binding cassette subfamily F protein uup
MPPILIAQNISKRFGAVPLFDNISCAVHDGDRIGLIGPNGAGKSTLLAILGAEQQPDSGEVSFRKGVRMGFVRQISDFAAEITVRQVIEAALERAAVPAIAREQWLRETLGRAGFTESDTTANPGKPERRLAQAACHRRSPRHRSPGPPPRRAHEPS